MRKKYPSWQQRHDAVLRWIFEHPATTQKECAQALGYTASQVSRIINSGDFRIKYRALSETMFQKIIENQITKWS